MARILIVEDEEKLARMLELELTYEGYQAEKAFGGPSGLALALSGRFDLVLLDIMLPRLSGMEVLRRLRREEQRYTPVLLLTARDAVMDKVSGLDAGAEDYITKPFAIEELLARIRAALRSIIWNSSGDTSKSLVLKDLEIRFDQRQVLVGGQEVRLTQTEYNIVVLLAQHAGKVLTYAAIIREIWGVSDPGSIKKLQVNMANIRKKLGARPGAENYIANELGVGYRMTDG